MLYVLHDVTAASLMGSPPIPMLPGFSLALGLKVLVLLWNIYAFICKVVSLLLGLFKNVLKNFIGILLMYSVVLVSGGQQSESVMHIHISTPF